MFGFLPSASLREGGRWKGSGSSMDAFLGLLFSLALCVLVTGAIKVFVGRPRPNYFALHALIQYGGTDVYSSLEASAAQPILGLSAKLSHCHTVILLALLMVADRGGSGHDCSDVGAPCSSLKII